MSTLNELVDALIALQQESASAKGIVREPVAGMSESEADAWVVRYMASVAAKKAAQDRWALALDAWILAKNSTPEDRDG